MTSAEYSDKLKDPRWQKKRLEIFERDKWACQMCHRKDKTLIVHHKRYLVEHEPWEYSNEYLITLCESCHDDERTQRPDIESDLIGMLRLHFTWVELHSLFNGLNGMEIPAGESNPYLYTLKELIKQEEELIAFINQPKGLINGKPAA